MTSSVGKGGDAPQMPDAPKEKPPAHLSVGEGDVKVANLTGSKSPGAVDVHTSEGAASVISDPHATPSKVITSAGKPVTSSSLKEHDISTREESPVSSVAKAFSGVSDTGARLHEALGESLTQAPTFEFKAEDWGSPGEGIGDMASWGDLGSLNLDSGIASLIGDLVLPLISDSDSPKEKVKLPGGDQEPGSAAYLVTTKQQTLPELAGLKAIVENHNGTNATFLSAPNIDADKFITGIVLAFKFDEERMIFEECSVQKIKGSNFHGFFNPQLNAAVIQDNAALNHAQRNQIVSGIQAFRNENNLPAAPLLFITLSGNAWSNFIQNVQLRLSNLSQQNKLSPESTLHASSGVQKSIQAQKFVVHSRNAAENTTEQKPIRNISRDENQIARDLKIEEQSGITLAHKEEKERKEEDLIADKKALIKQRETKNFETKTSVHRHPKKKQ